MAKKIKAKGIDQFREFFDKPESFRNKEFYEWAEKWGAYFTAHSDALDSFDEDEWGDISDRVLDELERRAVIGKEFEEIGVLLEAARENNNPELRIAVQTKWLTFMKLNQFDYDFTDEQISTLESKLEDYIKKVKECEEAKKKLELLFSKHQKFIEKFDDNIAEKYERTGKRPVYTSLPGGNRLKGN